MDESTSILRIFLLLASIGILILFVNWFSKCFTAFKNIKEILVELKKFNKSKGIE